MADAALASLRENATKLGQRLTENLAEHSRDLGLVVRFAPRLSMTTSDSGHCRTRSHLERRVDQANTSKRPA